jgi:hypothetical protein
MKLPIVRTIIYIKHLLQWALGPHDTYRTMGGDR